MKIGKYEFKKTCDACPEQYDVFDPDGKQVAYVRLRWGGLYASCPDVGGTIVYEADAGGHDGGCFKSDSERMRHLRKIAERIEWFNYPIICPHCGENIVPEDIDYLYDMGSVGKAVFDCPECDRYFMLRDDGDGPYICS